IHVAGGDAEIQIRLAERAKRFRRLPVGLTDDADAEALRFQQSADQCHTEARMVDIGVAGDQNHVATVPTEPIHFLTAHRQKRRAPGRERTKWRIAAKVARSLHERCRTDKTAARVVTVWENATV